MTMKKQFKKFMCYRPVHPKEGSDEIQFQSGRADTEFEMLLDLYCVTAVVPQTVHSAMANAHFTGSKLLVIGVPGVNFVVVKENVDQMHDILRKI